MFFRIQEYFLSEPERLIRLGSTLAYLGGLLIVFALLGNVATGTIGVIGSLGGQANTVKVLADIYPSLPTWWIPESIIGSVPAVFMMAVGMVLSELGKRIKHFMKSL